MSDKMNDAKKNLDSENLESVSGGGWTINPYGATKMVCPKCGHDHYAAVQHPVTGEPLNHCNACGHEFSDSEAAYVTCGDRQIRIG